MNAFSKLALIAGFALAVSPLFSQTAKEPVTWVVTVGTEAVNGTWQYNKIYPSDLTIHTGDKVTFRFVTGDMHNVVFPAAGKPAISGMIADPANPKMMMRNPAAEATAGSVYEGTAVVSSGILKGTADKPTDYTLTFTKEGDLVYTCTVHAQVTPDGKAVGMVAYLHVKPAGAPLPVTPEAASAEAKKTIAADVASAETADKSAHQVTSRPDGKGHQIWTVGIGATSANGGEYMGFAADNLKIKLGDTVEWIQRAEHAPHTVTFSKKGEAMMEMGPAAFAPSGGPTFDGTTDANSGFLPSGHQNRPRRQAVFADLHQGGDLLVHLRAPCRNGYGCEDHGRPVSTSALFCRAVRYKYR